LRIDHRNYKTCNRYFMTQHRLSITSSNENYYHSYLNGSDKKNWIALYSHEQLFAKGTI
jgi:hypothetical protein